MGLIELTGFGDLLRAIGVLFWLLVIAALLMALTLPKTKAGKAMAVSLVVGLFIAFPGRWGWDRKQQTDAVRARRAKAEAMFQERCKKSGEFIHKTAENVEGILLLKMRGQTSRGDQYKMDDPYGHDSADDEYLKSFLYGRNERGSLIVEGPVASKGYRYVDALDPKDGQRYRYTGRMDEPWKTNPHALEGHRVFVLDKTLASAPPRYGVTYDDISTREERDYWISGSSLKVIDLSTNEVIAERIGYMMDRGQGNNSGGRAAWLMAADHACPRFPADPGGHTYQTDQTRKFVEKTLKPSQER